jgi:signal peptidase I
MTRSRWIVLIAVSCCLIASVLGSASCQMARIEGRAMAPTLENQDRVVVNKLAYIGASPKRGDIVMLRYPRDRHKLFVKRVIAQGGDTLRIDQGRVYVNGEAVPDETYVPAEFRSHEDVQEHVVTGGHYYVIGDHRNNSSDSRHWGEVPEADVLGRVSVRWGPTPGVIR